MRHAQAPGSRNGCLISKVACPRRQPLGRAGIQELDVAVVVRAGDGPALLQLGLRHPAHEVGQLLRLPESEERRHVDVAPTQRLVRPLPLAHAAALAPPLRLRQQLGNVCTPVDGLLPAKEAHGLGPQRVDDLMLAQLRLQDVSRVALETCPGSGQRLAPRSALERLLVQAVGPRRLCCAGQTAGLQGAGGSCKPPDKCVPALRKRTSCPNHRSPAGAVPGGHVPQAAALACGQDPNGGSGVALPLV
mmetsp:Transcript_12041/g.37637  ORF Transcript_12041/g.37637 Transcript_12041/m.37637 type:complete len:247 (-) Transcript_12041:399-1139(-)